MAVEQVSQEALQSALAALHEIADLAASQAAALGEGSLGLTPLEIEATSPGELAGRIDGTVRAVVLACGDEGGDRIVYLIPASAGVDPGDERAIRVLEANVRHFLEGLAETSAQQLGPPSVEEWESVQPDKLPSDPLIKIDLEVAVGDNRDKIYLVLPATILSQFLQVREAGSESAKKEEEQGAMSDQQAQRKVEVTPPSFEEFAGESGERTPRNLEMLYDLSLTVSVELGRTQMTIGQVLELGKGSIVELDKMAGDPVDLYINGRKFAEGDVVVVEDRFGVRVTSLVGRADRLKTLGGGE